MAWHITKDHVDNDIGVGQWNGYFSPEALAKRDGLAICKKMCKHKFRMFDDDGELYYEGYSNDKDSEKAFDPLDHFGMPNAGCTEIKYLENELWETL